MYLVLEYLQQYLITTGLKLEHGMKDRDERVARLKDFIMKRIRYVLERDEMNLSLRAVAARLSLELEQVKTLGKFKMESLKESWKRVFNTYLIQNDDLMFLSREMLDRVVRSCVMCRL